MGRTKKKKKKEKKRRCEMNVDQINSEGKGEENLRKSFQK